MFKSGDYVVNSNNGICKIDGTVTMNTPNGNKEYYLLIPLNEPSAKIYIPLDSASRRIRYAMNREAAMQLINCIKNDTMSTRKVPMTGWQPPVFMISA